jgi:hypothetical protein
MCAQTKIANFLSPNWISELVWDSKSDKAGAPSNSSSEVEGGFEDKPGVSPVSIVLCKTRCPQDRPKKIKFSIQRHMIMQGNKKLESAFIYMHMVV